MTDIPTPKLPLTRQPTSNGHIWRQADGTVFSATEYEEWLWGQLERLKQAEADLNVANEEIASLEVEIESLHQDAAGENI